MESMADWLRGLLSEGIVEVVFTKKNGEERYMKCTTNFEKIKEFDMGFIPPNGKGAKKTDAVVSAYDVDAAGWRTINMATLKTVNGGKMI